MRHRGSGVWRSLSGVAQNQGGLSMLAMKENEDMRRSVNGEKKKKGEEAYRGGGASMWQLARISNSA
jgi:hypothetical protein